MGRGTNVVALRFTVVVLVGRLAAGEGAGVGRLPPTRMDLPEAPLALPDVRAISTSHWPGRPGVRSPRLLDSETNEIVTNFPFPAQPAASSANQQMAILACMKYGHTSIL